MAKSEQMDKKAPEQEEEEEENEEEEAETSGMSDVSKSFVEGRVATKTTKISGWQNKVGLPTFF